ncbi:MAG TPA: hypothetical protein VGH73_08335 [Thermoanaerobaculia bacterium]|jgi:hypothetical protein
MKIASRTILSAAVVALLSPMMARPAHAQRAAGVQILVRTVDKQEAVRINPGETVTAAEGTRVRVNVEVVVNGSRTPRYPTTQFFDMNHGGVRIVRANASNAAADFDILPMRNPRRIQQIQYRISDSWVPAGMRTGSFNIQVAPGSGAGASAQPGYEQPGYGRPGQGGWGSDRARELTRVLYRGILLRDPDPGAGGTIDAIRNGGYDGLVNAAVSIANSNESRITIPTRGVSAQQRLEALYQNLLGLSADQVDQRTWSQDLRTLNDGHIAQVVEGIVRSNSFRSRNNIAGY